MDFLGSSLQNIISISFLFLILLFLFFVWTKNKWHSLSMSEIALKQRIIITITLLITILISVLPMSLSPYWTGSIKAFADKQQYDRMGDALLQGRLYIDNGDIDPALEAMENPYDTKKRERLGVKYHWDEAYYNHHYYMYFGVVPTIILFIPFKLLTGTALLSYQATQIFAAFTIIGLFYLFYLYCKNYFQKFPFSLYLLFSSALSILSISYSIAFPALYCTAIVSGICMMVWSIVCFFKSMQLKEESKCNLFLFLGAVLGALAFGCRPPVALANIVVFVVISEILQTCLLERKVKIEKILLILVPYLVIGIMLMLYNYARFDNVFEFGQSYQLTLADQHVYRNFWENFNAKKTIIASFLNFYLVPSFTDNFPFIRYCGVFFNYPILLLSVRIFSKSVSQVLQEKQLYSFSLLSLISTVVITIFTVYWSPFLLERYHLDFYYVLCIVSFIAAAAWLESVNEKKKKLLIIFMVFLLFAVYMTSFLFFCIPVDGSYTVYYPEVLINIYKGLRFGL